jgi:hypothetical protein
LQFQEVKVKTGEAYILGEKIEIEAEQTVVLDDVQTEANIIWAKYKLSDSCEPNANRQHSITGQSYCVWEIDDFEFGATKESQYLETSDKLKLARVAKVEGVLTVTNDYRLYLVRGQIDWANVRIVDPAAADYQSIVAAIQSLTASAGYKVIWIMPGDYNEDIVISSWPTGVDKVCLIGLGRVLINGKFDGGAVDRFVLLENLGFKSATADVLFKVAGTSGYGYASLMINECSIKQTNPAGIGCEIYGKTIVKDSYVYACQNNTSAIKLMAGGGARGRLKIINSMIETGGTNVHGIGFYMTDNTVNDLWCMKNEIKTSGYSITDLDVNYGKGFMSACRYNRRPKITNAILKFGTLTDISNVLVPDDIMEGMPGDWE